MLVCERSPGEVRAVAGEVFDTFITAKRRFYEHHVRQLANKAGANQPITSLGLSSYEAQEALAVITGEYSDLPPPLKSRTPWDATSLRSPPLTPHSYMKWTVASPTPSPSLSSPSRAPRAAMMKSKGEEGTSAGFYSRQMFIQYVFDNVFPAHPLLMSTQPMVKTSKAHAPGTGMSDVDEDRRLEERGCPERHSTHHSTVTMKSIDEGEKPHVARGPQQQRQARMLADAFRNVGQLPQAAPTSQCDLVYQQRCDKSAEHSQNQNREQRDPSTSPTTVLRTISAHDFVRVALYLDSRQHAHHKQQQLSVTDDSIRAAGAQYECCAHDEWFSSVLAVLLRGSSDAKNSSTALGDDSPKCGCTRISSDALIYEVRDKLLFLSASSAAEHSGGKNNDAGSTPMHATQLTRPDTPTEGDTAFRAFRSYEQYRQQMRSPSALSYDKPSSSNLHDEIDPLVLIRLMDSQQRN